ncbi:hypothetical protein PENSPDRAFT_594156 [Peniophora sp. CONT]|nr:hypothetical protein PENSPDRAFT_594156 [Peniophora sp. CONT]
MENQLGVFHYANPPIHTHPRCEYCEKTWRCIGQDDSLKLLRCTGCNVVRYCSKECHQKDWKRRHKRSCKAWQDERDKAIESSGNPHAWTDFVLWLEFHHDSLANASLAYFIALRSGSEMHNSPGFFVVKYINDPNLPPERKFRYTHSRMDRMDFSPGSSFAELASRAALMDEAAAHQAKISSARTGVYVVQADFGGKEIASLPGIFTILNAHLAAGVVQDLHEKIPASLMLIFSRGQRQRFCCGRVSELSTCCCGGWTHKEQNDERNEGREVSFDSVHEILSQFIVAHRCQTRQGSREGPYRDRSKVRRFCFH